MCSNICLFTLLQGYFVRQSIPISLDQKPDMCFALLDVKDSSAEKLDSKSFQRDESEFCRSVVRTRTTETRINDTCSFSVDDDPRDDFRIIGR